MFQNSNITVRPYTWMFFGQMCTHRPKEGWRKYVVYQGVCGSKLTEVEGGDGTLCPPQNFKLPSKFRHLMG